ncbi:MAG: PH domain-containing protein [Chloroflexota bacterium]
MSIESSQARIQSKIWQAIAQGDIDLTGLEREQVEGLVNLATEAALIEMNSEIGTMATATKQARPVAQGEKGTSIWDDNKEDTLWEGRPFLSLTLHYLITDERIRITEGLLGKTSENIELVRVQDVQYSQTMTERLLNLGDVTITSHHPNQPSIMLKNVENPSHVYEILRRAILNARKKHNFTYREEM